MGKKKSAGSSSRRRTRQRTAVDKRAIELAERMQEALNYRRLGYTYQQISESMERPISTVRRWVTDAIKAIPREAADEVRKQMLDRLDYMMQNLMRAVQDAADSSTISALLQIEDRRAKLLGLYALPDCLDGGGFEVPEILHRRLIERITADAPVLRHDVPIPLKPIM